jgi:CheY-like chemotaxis protein
VLQKAGHEVFSAPYGAQGLKLMRQKKPEVVLLDIMMSYVLDGLDVRREMAEDPQLSTIPVIIMTSLTGVMGTDASQSDEAIPDSRWLSKPVDPPALLACIDEALAQ